MAHGNQLPEGFEIVTESLPEGFVIQQPTEQATATADEGGISPTTVAMVPALGQLDDVRAVLGEFASAANRTIAETVDFFGPGAINAVLAISRRAGGPDLPDVPTLRGPMEGTSFEGGFMEPSARREIISAAGATIPAFASSVTAVPRAAGTIGSVALDLLGVGSTKVTAPIGTALRATGEALTPGRAAAVKEAELPLLRESGDVAAAGFKLDEAGKVVTDRVQKAAIKQGFQEGFVAQVKAAPKAAKAKFRQMVDIAEKGRKNFRFAASNRPLDIAGGALDKRIRVVKSANRAAGRRLDSVVEGLGDETVDASSAVNNFTDNLDSMGIQFDPATKKISFQGSDLEDQPGPQKVLESVLKRMLRPGADQAKEVHKIKRFIDSIVTFGKTERGLSGSGERVLKQLRKDLDGALDDQFPEYDRVNSVYAETIQALDAIQDVAGRKMDFSGQNIDKALGTLTRRLLSNAGSRVPLMDSLEELDRLANKYVNSGATDIVPFRELNRGSGVTAADLGDDIVGQVMFADELEQMFGTSARTSLQGEVQKGTQQAARVSRGTVEAAAEVAGGVLEKARGINEANAFTSLRDLLAD